LEVDGSRQEGDARGLETLDRIGEFSPLTEDKMLRR
jgi:hypothetical protein